ncbi:hypothetical protein [Rhodococcus opacus]|uniref:hypothetical protein n=1 Tax=Rhodococcus opacus TaxID=37919 RepID=UPI001F57F637|nr:hypothetical protein [Rhodococcus opacus]UNN05186.1 hypothetical protein MOO23_40455 [Rhodococcus opacus]
MARVFPSATQKNYQTLGEQHDVDVVTGIARSYINAAIAHPKTTVRTGWSISCLPATGPGTRLFTVNVGAVEGAYMWTIPDDVDFDGYLITVYVDRNTLEAQTGHSLSTLEQKHADDVYFEKARHRKFKGRAIGLTAGVFGRSIEFPEGLPWQPAAAALVDQLMAESDCVYSQYHNRWLAEDVLAGAKRGRQEGLSEYLTTAKTS